MELFTVSPEYPESKQLRAARRPAALGVVEERAGGPDEARATSSQRLYHGTLARMPLGGGAPREILEDVREADWSPDGEHLAIIRERQRPRPARVSRRQGPVRDAGLRQRSARLAGRPSASRSSSTRSKYDDRGGVAVVEITPARRRRSPTATAGSKGSPGRATAARLLFSASYASQVYAVTLAGAVRQVLESAGGLDAARRRSGRPLARVARRCEQRDDG